jgi:hypothetical protein
MKDTKIVDCEMIWFKGYEYILAILMLRAMWYINNIFWCYLYIIHCFHILQTTDLAKRIFFSLVYLYFIIN